MPDPVWYYARGDVEKGPLSAAQIKALAAAGKIRPDDYVWKEGMDHWLPAGEVRELFSVETAKPKEREQDSGPSGDKRSDSDKTERRRQRRGSRGAALRSLAAEPQELVRLASRLSLLVGVLAVLLARGCDSLGARYAARLEAIAASAESRFQADWEQTRQELEQQKNAIQTRSQPSPSELAELRDLSTRLSQLDQKMREEESLLQASRWRAMKTNAILAGESNRMWGFWREMLFQLGTLVLAFGLVTVAYASDGPERWICLVVLAVIIYSVFNGSQPPGL
ncbi:MAG: DUF4339 domain-containing protein [Pirellulaceae bacterium]